MSHIFISYSKQNIDFARYLRAMLLDAGFAVWLDETRLSPGDDWWDSIEHSIDTCMAVIVVMSPEAKDSRWVKREILHAENRDKPLFPVLMAGAVWARLADLQFEDLRAGLRAELSTHFINRLRAIVPARHVMLDIVAGSIIEYEADVVGLKFARFFQGADRAVATHLLEHGALETVEYFNLSETEHRLLDTQDTMPAGHLLLVGVPHFRDMTYSHIRELATRTLQALKDDLPNTRHLAMTIHGPGFGLDEAEALRSQIAGYLDAIRSGDYPPTLERITIVEVAKKRIGRLQTILRDYADTRADIQPITSHAYRLIAEQADGEPAAIPAPEIRPYVLALLSEHEDNDDVFYYGIQGAAHAFGLLCERVDPAVLENETLESVQNRIATATLIVAEVSQPDMHTYLHLGYAWGARRPVVLLARGANTFPYPLERIVYDKIHELESALLEHLAAL